MPSAPPSNDTAIYRLQKLSTTDLEDLVDWMLTSGRRRGGKPGTGLFPQVRSRLY
jgi:hypothetical protein